MKDLKFQSPKKDFKQVSSEKDIYEHQIHSSIDELRNGQSIVYDCSATGRKEDVKAES